MEKSGFLFGILLVALVASAALVGADDSPKAIKLSVIHSLQSLSGDKQLTKDVAKTIKNIQKSLTYFADDAILADDGDKSFEAEKKAVENLLGINAKKLTSDQTSIINTAVSELVRADSLLASGNLQRARATTFASVDNQKKASDSIDSAQKKLDAGNTAFSKGKYAEAIGKFKESWSKSQDVIRLKAKELAKIPGTEFDFPDLGAVVIVHSYTPVAVTAVPTSDPTIIDPNKDGTYGGLNKFYEFHASGPFDWAEIRVNYDPTILTNYVDENTLKLRWWDPSTNDWAHTLDSGVNTKQHYVWATVNHFSEWAPIADPLGQYANNFELGRASKPNVPLGTYIKKSYESFNADDVAVAPYDIMSGEDFGGTSTHSVKFDGPLLKPVYNDVAWLETGTFDVTENTPYTFSFDVKYMPSEAGSPDAGDIYYYEMDADGNFVRTADLIAFNADGATSQRDWITVTSESIQGKSGWQHVTATLTTEYGVSQAKIAFTEFFNQEGAGHDSYLVDDFTYAAV